MPHPLTYSFCQNANVFKKYTFLLKNESWFILWLVFLNDLPVAYKGLLWAPPQEYHSFTKVNTIVYRRPTYDNINSLLRLCSLVEIFIISFQRIYFKINCIANQHFLLYRINRDVFSTSHNQQTCQSCFGTISLFRILDCMI